MRKILCVLLAIAMCFLVGCKRQIQNIARDIVVDKAMDTLADNANKGSNGSKAKSPDGSSSNMPNRSGKGKAGVAAAVTGGAIAAVANEVESSANNHTPNGQNMEQRYTQQEEPDWHWIKDNNTGVYIWNPEPEDGEYIVWNGGYVEVGKYRYANGLGIVTWYKNGKVIQVDNGAFDTGRHHGKFTHKFPSGKVIYSNWDHGREIK